MKVHVAFTLQGDAAELAAAYAADRGLEVYQVARAALLSTIKRDVGRSGLLATIDKIVERRVGEAVAARSASAEGAKP